MTRSPPVGFLSAMRRMCLLVVRLPVGVPPPAGGRFYLGRAKLAGCGENLHSLRLLAPDDLTDPRVVQAHQLADGSQR